MMRFREENTRFGQLLDIDSKVFGSPVLTVELSERAARRSGNAAAFALAVNLLARTFERVHVVFPASTELQHHPWNLKMVGDIVDELNRTVGGSIWFGSPSQSDVVLSIGDIPSVRARREVLVSGSDWVSALDCELPGSGRGKLGSLYAATMGAAQVLLHVLELAGAPYRPMKPILFSLLDLLPSGTDRILGQSVRIPDAHLAGVGAVGSAAIYALAHFGNVCGTTHLIDNDKVDDTNLNRYVLMRQQDVGRFKVVVAAEGLGNTAVHSDPFAGSFADFLEERGPNVDLLLTPVDSQEGRRAIARRLPRRVINASTGETAVTLSTHGFADGKACLHCLYSPEPNQKTNEEVMAEHLRLPAEMVRELVEKNTLLDANLISEIEQLQGVSRGTWSEHVGSPIQSFYNRAVCSDAELHGPTADVVAPLSFISASAGILLAAELVKAGDPELALFSLDNYFRFDTLHHPNPAYRQMRLQDASGNCICNDPDFVAVHAARYRKG